MAEHHTRNPIELDSFLKNLFAEIKPNSGVTGRVAHHTAETLGHELLVLAHNQQDLPPEIAEALPDALMDVFSAIPSWMKFEIGPEARQFLGAQNLRVREVVEPHVRDFNP